MSDEGIKCSRTLRDERRTVQKLCVAHAVLAQFLDVFNVDFLVDPYTSGMVHDMFICCGLERLLCSEQGTNMTSKEISGRGRI